MPLSKKTKDAVSKDFVTYTHSNSSVGSGSAHPHYSYPNTTSTTTPYNPYTNPYSAPVPPMWPNIPSHHHGYGTAVTNDNFILTHCHPMLRGLSKYISSASFTIDHDHRSMDRFLQVSALSSINLQYTIKMFNHELDVSLFNTLVTDYDVMKTDIIIFTLDKNTHKYIVVSDYVCQSVSSHASYEETSIFSFDLEFKSAEYEFIDLMSEH